MKRVSRALAALLTAGAIATAQDVPPPDPAGPAEGEAEHSAALAEGDGAEPAAPAESAVATPAELVKGLSSESYKEREAAFAALWALGEAGEEELARSIDSDDPELAYRSRRLLRRIRANVTPESPAEILKLVEAYYRGGPEGKMRTLDELKDLKAYSQVLRLYRFEEDPEIRDECLELVEETVLPALRQELAGENYDGAEAILRVAAPATGENLRRRAALSRARGRADEDLAAAEAAGDQDWKLALLRAKGDIPAVIAAARAMGREDLVGAMSLFEGNPVPFLDWFAGNSSNSATMRLHAEIARDRWLGKEKQAAKYAGSLAKDAGDENDDQRGAMVSLMLNGYREHGMTIMRRNHDDYRDLIYGLYESLEDPVRAIAVFGYKGTAKEKEDWVAEQMRKIRANETRASVEWNTVLTVASFLMARGEREQALEIAGQLADVMKNQRNDGEWLEFLGELGNLGIRSKSFYELAFGLAADELGDDADDGTVFEVIAALFQEGDIARRHWKRLKGEEKLSDAERILLLGGIYGMVELPAGEVGAVLKKLRAEAMELEGEKKREALSDLVDPAVSRDDTSAVLELLELLAEIDGVGRWVTSLGIYYGYMNRWEKAEEVLSLGHETNPASRGLIATLAAVKLRLGKDDEARELLGATEIHSLDEPDWLMTVAEIFEKRNLDRLAEGSWRRLLVTSSPSSRNRAWILACARFAKQAKLRRDWRVAAAFMEVEALFDNGSRATYVNPVFLLRTRFKADLLRAMALHEEGNDAEARALFDRCFKLLIGDGMLADDFFPLLREAGFIEEHDRYFAEAYEQILASIEAYPRTHNTYNGAAWLASRAVRRLDEAEAMATKAIDMRPRQAAYLDTMAEVWFARRNRAKAIEWSTKALQESENTGHQYDGGAELRRQFERFQSGDFPVP